MSRADETHWHLLKPLDVVRLGEDEDPSVWLGRVVLNFNSPHKGYVSPSGIVGLNRRSRDSHTQSDGQVFHFVDDPNFTDMNGLIARAESTNSKVQVPDFLEVFKSNKSSQNPSFTSKSVRRLRIEQEDDAITAIIDDAAVQAKIEKRDAPVKQAYLIAAILVTEVEVSYDDNSSTEKGSSSAAAIPAPVVSAAVSALSSAPAVVHSPIGLNHTKSETATTSLKTSIKGQNIIAIDYRVLDRPRSFFPGSRKQIRQSNKLPRGDRFFGHNDVVAPGQEAELPKIKVCKGPLYHFDSTALEQSFTLEE